MLLCFDIILSVSKLLTARQRKLKREVIIMNFKDCSHFVVGNYTYKETSEAVDMVNVNCDVAGEERIPMKIEQHSLGWGIVCLNESDKPRLDRHLRYIYGIE
jgi:hypothetical protein